MDVLSLGWWMLSSSHSVFSRHRTHCLCFSDPLALLSISIILELRSRFHGGALSNEEVGQLPPLYISITLKTFQNELFLLGSISHITEILSL